MTIAFTVQGETRAGLRMAAAAGLGVGTQALVWRSSAGLGTTAAAWLLVGAALLAFRSRDGRLPWGASIGAPAACALVASASITARASSWSLGWGTVATLASLLVLVAACARRQARGAPVDVEALGGVAADAVGAIVRAPEAARRGGATAGASARAVLGGEGRRVAAGLLLGLPVTGLLLLLLAADRTFARALRAGLRGSGDAVELVLASLATGALALLVYDLHAAHAERSASVDETRGGPPLAVYRGGGALAPREQGAIAELRTPVLRRLRFRASTLLAVLGQLGLVLSLFAAVAARHALGGHAWLQAHGTTTYAGAVHAGFVQVSLAVVVVVGVVLAGKALLVRADDEPERARSLLKPASLALLALATAPLLVSHEHLRLYEEAYGTTYQRLLVACAQVAMAGLLAMSALHIAAPRLPGFGAGVVLAALAFATGLAWLNADAIVLGRNLARAASGAVDATVSTVPLDEEYLATLSADARGGVPPVPDAHCERLRRLVHAWDADRPRGLRARRGLLRAALPDACAL